MKITPMAKYRRLTAAGAVFYQCPVCTYNTHNPTRMKKHLERSCGAVAEEIVEEPMLLEADKARERVSKYTPEKLAELEARARKRAQSESDDAIMTAILKLIRLKIADFPDYMTLLDQNKKLAKELKDSEDFYRQRVGAKPAETLFDAIQRLRTEAAPKPTRPGLFERIRNWWHFGGGFKIS